MERVAGKVAIVTGAASAAGLGFATARALAREGAKVVLTDIDEAAIRRRAGELVAAGGQALGLRHDVAAEADWIAVVARTIEHFGGLHVLVNNAGITLRARVDQMALDVWSRVLAVNLTGAFLGCKHAVAAMRRQGRGGSIVNVASISARVGFPNSCAYGSSKGGLRQLSKVVAIEGAADNIRCNSVYPGLIRSDILQGVSRDAPAQFNQLVASIPMARMGEPDDIGNCILFLAADESKYITGAEIVVDGGLLAQ